MNSKLKTFFTREYITTFTAIIGVFVAILTLILTYESEEDCSVYIPSPYHSNPGQIKEFAKCLKMKNNKVNEKEIKKYKEFLAVNIILENQKEYIEILQNNFLIKELKDITNTYIAKILFLDGYKQKSLDILNNIKNQESMLVKGLRALYYLEQNRNKEAIKILNEIHSSIPKLKNTDRLAALNLLLATNNIYPNNKGIQEIINQINKQSESLLREFKNENKVLIIFLLYGLETNNNKKELYLKQLEEIAKSIDEPSLYYYIGLRYTDLDIQHDSPESLKLAIKNLKKSLEKNDNLDIREQSLNILLRINVDNIISTNDMINYIKQLIAIKNDVDYTKNNGLYFGDFSIFDLKLMLASELYKSKGKDALNEAKKIHWSLLDNEASSTNKKVDKFVINACLSLIDWRLDDTYDYKKIIIKSFDKLTSQNKCFSKDKLRIYCPDIKVLDDYTCGPRERHRYR